jgi:hypothetical protein
MAPRLHPQPLLAHPLAPQHPNAEQLLRLAAAQPRWRDLGLDLRPQFLKWALGRRAGVPQSPAAASCPILVVDTPATTTEESTF